ncbi:MAG: hypothetical protein WCP43_05045 [Dehalococcoidia bacterium]
MRKPLLNAIAAACMVFITIAAGCSSQPAPAAEGNLSVENGTLVILVENTSISLKVTQLEPGGDPLAEFMRSILNILEGKGR